jgi:fermentation-respiration switch protein FrsA (DUF1100 family)
MVETVLKTLAAVVAGLVALKLLVLLLQPSLTFFPTRRLDGTPAEVGVPFRDLTIPTSDGETLNAWLLPHDRPRAQVLYFHGNGGNLWIWSPILLEIHARGMTVLALDYRGYGKSTGRPSEHGLYRDTEALVGYFQRELRAPGPPVVYWGRSLGATMAAYATTIAPPDGLILEGGFPDTAALLAGSPLLRTLGLFSSYRFPTARFANEGGSGADPTPVLVLHGDADSVVPYDLGRRLFEKLEGEKRFHRVRGGDHNDVVLADPASYWEAVLGFVDWLTRRALTTGERIGGFDKGGRRWRGV